MSSYPPEQDNATLLQQTPPMVSSMRAKPWGLGTTIGLSILGIVIIVLGGAVVGIVAGVVAGISLDAEEFADFKTDIESNGLLNSLVLLVTTPMVIGWLLLFAVMRRGPTLMEYFAIRMVRGQSMLGWILATIAFALVTDLIAYAIGRPYVPEHMIHMYETAVIVPLLWFTVVVLASIGNEMLFRGFFFAGVIESRLGPIGAVLLSAFAFSVMQIQQDVHAVVVFFFFALLIGFARIRTASLLPCIAMSATWNFYSLLMCAIYTATHPATQAV